MKKKSSPLTSLELQIMEVLWAEGPCTTAEVVPKLKGNRAYTTVQTMLNILLRKKRVSRSLEGRAHRYKAVVPRERAIGNTLSDLVSRMFGGSTEALLMALMDTKQVTADELIRVGTERTELEATRKD